MLNPKKIWHENLTDLSTSPVRCSHFTLVNPKKSFSTVLFIRTSWLFMLSQKKTNCNPSTCPPHLKMSPHYLVNWLQNFFILLKVCCVLSKLEALNWRQPVWVVVGGSENNRLWCVATGMSGKQCHSKCSEWPPSASIHASSLFRHRPVA